MMRRLKAFWETEGIPIMLASLGWVVAIGFGWGGIGAEFVTLPIQGGIFALLYLRKSRGSKLLGLLIPALHLLGMMESMARFS